MKSSRRQLMMLMAGAILTPEGLWLAGQKSIILPAKDHFEGNVYVIPVPVDAKSQPHELYCLEVLGEDITAATGSLWTNHHRIFNDHSLDGLAGFEITSEACKTLPFPKFPVVAHRLSECEVPHGLMEFGWINRAQIYQSAGGKIAVKQLIA